MSRSESRSSLTRSESDASSHVSLDSNDWDHTISALDFDKPGTAAWRQMPAVQKATVSVDHTGKLRAEKEYVFPLQLSLAPARIKALTPSGKESSPFLCLREGQPSNYLGPAKEGITECVIEKATGKSVVHSRYRKTLEGRKALAANLGLKSKGDRYTVWARSDGCRGVTPLYEAADRDSSLEKHISDISESPFHAQAGVMRMPLKVAKNITADRQTSDCKGSLQPRHTVHSKLVAVKSGKTPQLLRAEKHTFKYPLDGEYEYGKYIAKTAGSKACVFGQELRRSASGRKNSSGSGSGSGRSAVDDGMVKRHETLAIHGTEPQLTYEDTRYYPWFK